MIKIADSIITMASLRLETAVNVDDDANLKASSDG